MPERVDPATALIPLRVFLGATFVYGGWQKLSDPGFLHPGSATWIGTQLHGFASNTPGGFLIRWFAEPFPGVAGVGVALTEIAIGLLVLLGFYTRLAATLGLTLNLVLFLTASWNTYPYFLGSDIVFVFAWLPFVLAGAAGQPALDTMLERPRTTSRRTADGRVIVAHRMSREQALKRGAVLVGGLTLGIAGLATVLRGSYRSTSAVGTNPTAAATTPKDTPGVVRRDEHVLGVHLLHVPGRTVWRRRPGRDLRRSGEDVHRPRRRRRGHRCALLERDADRSQRGLYSRRVHGGIPGRSLVLSVPRLTVQCPDRRGAPGTGVDAAAAQARDRAQRQGLRRLTADLIRRR